MKVLNLPLSAISPSPMNPRKTFDQAELDELADNIRQQGLLQPITVRPTEYSERIGDRGEIELVPSAFEIVCGERRYRAVKQNNPGACIASIVREMTDDEAFMAMVTENLQRKDVSPIEEAYAFQQLSEKGMAIEEIAAKFGKSVRFVQDRIKLNSLIPEMMLAVKEERLPLSAAMLIGKLPQEDQRKFHAQTRNMGYVPKATAVNFVSGLFRNIAAAPWAKGGDGKFDGGCGVMCAECQHNSNNAGCLFYEMKGSPRDAKCTCQEKFDSKQIAYFSHRLDEIAPRLAKKGEGIGRGKAVVIDPGVPFASSRAAYEKARQIVEQRGYEMIRSCELRRCWYQPGDERIAPMLESGEAIEGYNLLGNSNWLTLAAEYYYTGDSPAQASAGQSREDVEAVSLAGKYAQAEKEASKAIAEKMCELLEKEPPSSKPLTRSEEAALVSYLLATAPNEIKGACCLESTAEACDFVAAHPEQWGFVLRETLRRGIVREAVTFGNAGALEAARRLGKAYYPAQFDSETAKAEAMVEKKRAKIEARLSELGYGIDGKKLER